jgi:hypothetical protein
MVGLSKVFSHVRKRLLGNPVVSYTRRQRLLAKQVRLNQGLAALCKSSVKNKTPAL